MTGYSYATAQRTITVSAYCPVCCKRTVYLEVDRPVTLVFKRHAPDAPVGQLFDHAMLYPEVLCCSPEHTKVYLQRLQEVISKAGLSSVMTQYFMELGIAPVGVLDQ